MKDKKKIDPFAVTEEEYLLLDKQFSKLSFTIAWQLLGKNLRNNHTEDFEDIVQNLRMAIIRSGRYYKRQMYIESCLKAAWDGAPDPFTKKVVEQLGDLWKNRTKHGANKQKFGDHQEKLLDYLVDRVVAPELRPDPRRPLVMDAKFLTYCKSITWNEQKSLGRKISRERAVRNTQVSISTHDHVFAYASEDVN